MTIIMQIIVILICIAVLVRIAYVNGRITGYNDGYGDGIKSTKVFKDLADQCLDMSNRFADLSKQPDKES